MRHLFWFSVGMTVVLIGGVIWLSRISVIEPTTLERAVLVHGLAIPFRSNRLEYQFDSSRGGFDNYIVVARIDECGGIELEMEVNLSFAAPNSNQRSFSASGDVMYVKIDDRNYQLYPFPRGALGFRIAKQLRGEIVISAEGGNDSCVEALLEATVASTRFAYR